METLLEIFIIFTLSFSLGSILDGIFLRKHDNGTKLTFLGVGFFWLVFFIFNFIINIFTFIFYKLSKSRKNYKFIKLLRIPEKKNHFVSFGYATLFYLVEIISGYSTGNYIIPNAFSKILNLQGIFFNFLIIIMLISAFAYLFFKALPYSKKKMPFIIFFIILLIIDSLTLFFMAFK